MDGGVRNIRKEKSGLKGTIKVAEHEHGIEIGDHVHGTINGIKACGTVVMIGGDAFGSRIYIDGGRSILARNAFMVDKTRRSR